VPTILHCCFLRNFAHRQTFAPRDLFREIFGHGHGDFDVVVASREDDGAILVGHTTSSQKLQEGCWDVSAGGEE